MANSIFQKNGKLIYRGTELVVPNDVYGSECLCCLDECDGICTRKCWELEVLECYYVACACGVCHNWSFSCGAGGTIRLPTFPVPCKWNGEKITRSANVIASNSANVDATRATRYDDSSCAAYESKTVRIDRWSSSPQRSDNFYCSDSYIVSSMSENGPKIVGHNCIATGSIGFRMSFTGCSCNGTKPRYYCRLKITLSGGAQVDLDGTTYSRNTTVNVGYPQFRVF